MLHQEDVSFQQLDDSEPESPMDEDDNDHKYLDEKRKEKVKPKAKGKGKAKAKDQGKTNDEGAKSASKVPPPRWPVQPMGATNEPPCEFCQERKFPCSIDVNGGACVMCKQKKVKCSLALKKHAVIYHCVWQGKKRSCPVISDTEDKVPPLKKNMSQ